MLELLTRILEEISNFAPLPVAILVVATSAVLLIIDDRRVALLPLLLQYILLAFFIGPRVYGPLVLVRSGLGVAICLIILITAIHAQRTLPQTPRAGSKTLGLVYRLLVIVFGGLITFGMWSSDLLPQLSSIDSFTSFGLIIMGLLAAASSSDPLRIGIGILTCLNGFETAFVLLQQGFLVIGLWGLVDILLVLAIVAGTESWLEARKVGAGE
ncbi:MAG: hypothetical protein ACYCZF_11180 [Anaerolineae bacterium]